MINKSLRNTIFINIGAFLLVSSLEILSGWLVRDQFDTNYSFYLWELNFAAHIMFVWIRKDIYYMDYYSLAAYY